MTPWHSFLYITLVHIFAVTGGATSSRQFIARSLDFDSNHGRWVIGHYSMPFWSSNHFFGQLRAFRRIIWSILIIKHMRGRIRLWPKRREECNASNFNFSFLLIERDIDVRRMYLGSWLDSVHPNSLFLIRRFDDWLFIVVWSLTKRDMWLR